MALESEKLEEDIPLILGKPHSVKWELEEDSPLFLGYLSNNVDADQTHSSPDDAN
jgi:hypothetical protein